MDRRKRFFLVGAVLYCCLALMIVVISLGEPQKFKSGQLNIDNAVLYCNLRGGESKVNNTGYFCITQNETITGQRMLELIG